MSIRGMGNTKECNRRTRRITQNKKFHAVAISHFLFCDLRRVLRFPFICLGGTLGRSGSLRFSCAKDSFTTRYAEVHEEISFVFFFSSWWKKILGSKMMVKQKLRSEGEMSMPQKKESDQGGYCWTIGESLLFSVEIPRGQCLDSRWKKLMRERELASERCKA